MLAASREHQRTTICVTNVILPLESLHVLDGEFGRQQRVLAGGFLAATPPRIPEDVDVGSPVGEAGLTDVVHSPGLHGDGAGHGTPKRPVKGRGGEDDLGELGGGSDGAIEGDAGAVGGDPVE